MAKITRVNFTKRYSTTLLGESDPSMCIAYDPTSNELESVRVGVTKQSKDGLDAEIDTKYQLTLSAHEWHKLAELVNAGIERRKADRNN